MSTTAKALTPTKVITGVVRLSYAHIFEPAKMKDDDVEKYSVSILIPKEDKESIKVIEAAIEAAKQEGITSKWGGKIPKNLKLPLRDGDDDREEDDNYANHLFIGATSKRKPGVLNQRKVAATQDEVYSGCYALVSINFYPFKHEKGGVGVSAGLQNILKVKDGEPLSGGSTAEADFANVEIAEEVEDWG